MLVKSLLRASGLWFQVVLVGEECLVTGESCLSAGGTELGVCDTICDNVPYVMHSLCITLICLLPLVLLCTQVLLCVIYPLNLSFKV